ncbi:MAG: hypothetical protein ACRBFS_21820 [Aureispira sp.]
MQRLLVLTTSVVLLLFLLIACGGDTVENAFPKKVPIDKRAQKEQSETLANRVTALTSWKNGRTNIETFLEKNSGYYQTADGNEALISEFTTYYLEEEKTTPIKTRYTYMTGSFDVIYWLPKGQLWLERDGYDFLIDGDRLVKTMRDGEPAQATSLEQTEALDIAKSAREETVPVNYTL